MSVAIVCVGLLGLLVFGLGLGVSLTRASTNRNFGYDPDPADRLYKMVRAHGNATEYAPMMAVLILLVGARDPATWMLWVFAIATAVRYLHAAGMIFSPTLARAHPLRVIGSAGTYFSGFALVVAALVA
jgi:uncharacterized membrane protein YecN with MAPEG domain